ncbi:MAG: nitroreductase family protein [Candidatus Cloacimonadaceae bacterium]
MKPKPKFDYPITELLQKRWSPRAFSSQPLTEEQVLTLFEAARWAASCNNEQPWRFIWSLKDDSEKYQKLLDCLKPGNREWAVNAPFLMVTLVQTNFDTGKKNKWARHDLGLAMGNLTAQATSMDLYVHNMAGFVADKVSEYFDLPEGIKPVTMVVIGYMGELSSLSEHNQTRELEPRIRKPLKELFLK